MVLDTNQTEKYYHLSPQLNSDHEANSNITTRILNFCGDLSKINFFDSDFAELNDTQKNLHGEWTERCGTSNFSFSISYVISLQQTESAKVSTSFKNSAQLQFQKSMSLNELFLSLFRKVPFVW